METPFVKEDIYIYYSMLICESDSIEDVLIMGCKNGVIN